MSFYPILPHPTFDEVDFATWEDGFTDDECNEIIRLGESLDAKDSTVGGKVEQNNACLLYTSPSPRDGLLSRLPSSA